MRARGVFKAYRWFGVTGLWARRGVMRVRVCTGRPGAEPEGPPSTPQQWTFRGTFLFPPGELCLASGQIPLAAPVPRQAGRQGKEASLPAAQPRPGGPSPPRGIPHCQAPPFCCEWNMAGASLGEAWGAPHASQEGWGQDLRAAPPALLMNGGSACRPDLPRPRRAAPAGRSGAPGGPSRACSPSPTRPPAPSHGCPRAPPPVQPSPGHTGGHCSECRAGQQSAFCGWCRGMPLAAWGGWGGMEAGPGSGLCVGQLRWGGGGGGGGIPRTEVRLEASGG